LRIGSLDMKNASFRGQTMGEAFGMEKFVVCD